MFGGTLNLTQPSPNKYCTSICNKGGYSTNSPVAGRLRAVHVATNMNRDEAGYIEALEHETRVLQKRVVACRSRIMLVTVFDVTSGPLPPRDTTVIT